jgi:diacylglycerol kinase family enzyme
LTLAKSGATGRTDGAGPDAPRLPGSAAPLPASRHANRPILVANGNASGLDRAAVDRVKSALTTHCDSVEVRITFSVEELDDVARQARGEDRRLVVFGGDGSVHAAANLPCTLAGECGLPDLGLIPAGRANNIARTLGIPERLPEAARAALELPSRQIDLVQVRAGEASVHVVEGVSVGIHSRLRARYQACNSADTLEAVRVALGAPRDLGRARVSLRLDDGEWQDLSVGQLFIANLSRYGPGLRVAPEAAPDDGQLDAVLLELRRPWASIVPTIVRLRRGTHVGRRGTRTWRAASIDLIAHDAPVIADTTVLDPGEARLRVMPQALPIAAPPMSS